MMRSFLICFAMLVISSRAKAQSPDEVQRLIADATTLIIVDARDVSHERTKSREVVLSEAKDIRAFSKSLRLSKEGIRGEKVMVAGEEVLVTAYCQCLPDFTVVVQTDKKETLRFGIQHWSHIRIGSGEQMVEHDFIPSTLNGLKKQLWKYFPTDEQIGRKEG